MVIGALLIYFDPLNWISWEGDRPQPRLSPDQFAKQVEGELCGKSIEGLQSRLDGLTKELARTSSDVSNLVQVRKPCLQPR